MRRKRGIKWSRYGADVIPCWVADMDFPLAPPIHRTLEHALAVGDFGYSGKLADSAIPEVFSAWARRRFDWEVDPARVIGMADVVQGMYLTIELFSAPGDGVATLTPVYPPFLRAVEETGRRLACYTLERGPERYEIDLERFEQTLGTDTRLLLLCNPHNPTGRTLEREELRRIGEIAVERDMVVLADEIHADLVYAPHRHVPFATLGPEIAARTITMTSATKSFNVAGLRFAVTVFGSEALQQTFGRVPERVRGGANSAGVYATRAAWTECDDWLESLVDYLEGNRDYLCRFVDQHLPGVRMHRPEATFLAWLDCREAGAWEAAHPSPFDFFLDQAKVALGDGHDFGDGGEGHVRLNFATSRAILTEIAERMERALTRSG